MKKQLVVLISPSTRRAIDRAKRQGRGTLSSIVETAVLKYLGPVAGPRRAPETK